MVEKAVEVAHAEKGALFAFDPREQELRMVAHAGLSPAIRSLGFKVGESVTGRAVLWGRPITIPDVETDTEHEVRVDLARREGIRAILTMPLMSKEQVVGALSVYHTQPHAFTDDEITRLRLYGHQAAIAIENARLFAATEQRASELATLQEIGQAVTSRLELPAVLEAVVAGAMRLLATQHTQIILWDEAAQSIRFGAAVGTEAERVRNQKFKLGLGINGTVALTRQPMILDDYQASPYAVPEC
ncbi:MAG: GAF domain-containing protein, partial [candidate division NC10 bacterium]|nr:GAF domain-containing protein [candidate division NC10 bacterium]